MTERRRRGVDPVEREIETALAPGTFIPDRISFAFVSDLEGVAATSAKLIPIEPARAVGLYESFLAGCYEKAEEVDDSSGSFGQFASDLFCGWIGARQAADAAGLEQDCAWPSPDGCGYPLAWWPIQKTFQSPLLALSARSAYRLPVKNPSPIIKATQKAATAGDFSR